MNDPAAILDSAESPASADDLPTRVEWTRAATRARFDACGRLVGLTHLDDPHEMNWIRAGDAGWGTPVTRESGALVAWDPPTLLAAAERDATIEFTRDGLTLTLVQTLDADGTLDQSFTLNSELDEAKGFAEGDFGLRVPLPDDYPDALTALHRRCNAHVWTGGHGSWINATRMSGAGPHLGLVLNAGELSAYSIIDRPWDSNDRGVFLVHPPAFTIAPGAAVTFGWTLFWHDGWRDFFARAMRRPRFIRLRADHYTRAVGEPITIDVGSHDDLTDARLTVNGRALALHGEGGRLSASFTPTMPGEQHVELQHGRRRYALRAFATPDPMALIAARVQFLLDHQQRDAPGEPSNRAFVIYDNEAGAQILDKRNDHNAGRERVGMGVLLALFLPRCDDDGLKARIERSLAQYLAFVAGHLQASDGTVFNDADDPTQRLYNYPWVARLHLAVFEATGDARSLDAFVRTVRAYYANGGTDFYPILMPVADGLATLAAQRRQADARELLGFFRAHADRIAAVGLAMPASEVNYEQSIVGPACEILLQVGHATGDKGYRDAAKPFLDALFAFNGLQPDHRLHDVAVRHWDGFWFGKCRLYGDTFPHYWSAITAQVLVDLARLDADDAPLLVARANGILANNRSLFAPDGSASCAYLYPLSVNGHLGRFADPWANDQDWALVYHLLLTR